MVDSVLLAGRVLSLCAVFIASSTGCLGAGLEYDAPKPPELETYLVAEGGRPTQLRRYLIRATHTPFASWKAVLVEACGSDATRPANALPCWPKSPQEPSQDFLNLLYMDNQPDQPSGPWQSFRDLRVLLDVARSVNPELGQSSPAWIVGTHPFALAYRDHSPNVQTYRGLATSGRAPTVEPVVRFKDIGANDIFRVPVVERNTREVTLFRPIEPNQLVNVVMLYDPSADVAAISKARRTAIDHGKTVADLPPGQILLLRQPRPLREVISLLADGKIEADAEHVIEMPVR